MTTFHTLASPTRYGAHDVTGKAGANDQGGRHETENAILLVGAVSIATVVVTVIKGYVSSNLPK